MATVILGLDLSTRAAAAVAVPSDWDGEWRRVASVVVGEPLHKGATEAERIGRSARIAARLAAFARAQGVTAAFIESYAYGQNTAAHTLGELGGLVRHALLESGVDVQVANMSSARRLMCGRIPRGSDPKAIVGATLRQAGAPAELLASADLCDAFVCLNFGMAELGGYCFAQAAA